MKRSHPASTSEKKAKRLLQFSQSASLQNTQFKAIDELQVNVVYKIQNFNKIETKFGKNDMMT